MAKARSAQFAPNHHADSRHNLLLIGDRWGNHSTSVLLLKKTVANELDVE